MSVYNNHIPESTHTYPKLVKEQFIWKAFAVYKHLINIFKKSVYIHSKSYILKTFSECLFNI